MKVTEWMEEGIRAYTRGDLAEAERCWMQVLGVEPNNRRARAYLGLLGAPTGPDPDDAVPPATASAEGSPGGDAAPAAATQPPVVAGPTSEVPSPPSPWDDGPSLAPAVVLGEGNGLDLATVSDEATLHPIVPDAVAGAAPVQRPPNDVEVWMEGARELFALGDFSGSLEMIEKILKVDPSHAEAREYLKQNETTLTAMYESKLGAPGSIPRLAIKPEEVMWLNLDHRAGFLLAQIDGTVSYEDLFALSGLPRLDTARILASLLQEGVIAS